jgi:hypothetical protein
MKETSYQFDTICTAYALLIRLRCRATVLADLSTKGFSARRPPMFHAAGRVTTTTGQWAVASLGLERSRFTFAPPELSTLHNLPHFCFTSNLRHFLGSNALSMIAADCRFDHLFFHQLLSYTSLSSYYFQLLGLE